jgi:hypothetical protein
MIPAKAIVAISIFTVVATVARGTDCVSGGAPLEAPVSTESVPRSTLRSEMQLNPFASRERHVQDDVRTKYIVMSAKVILAVVLGIAMLGVQACLYPSGGYANRSGYQYNQPAYSQQQYGQYGQYPAYGYSQVAPATHYEYSDSSQYPQYRQGGQYASRHAVCDSNGNNCVVCDADNDRCRPARSSNW